MYKRQSTASIVNISAINASITTLSVLNASISTASIVNISAINASITTLSVLNASISTASIVNISAINASITTLSCLNASISTASMTNLSAVNISLTGNITAYNGFFIGNIYTGYSDDRLKIKSFSVSNTVQFIKNLSVFKYYPNISFFNDLNIPYYDNQLNIGLSAQEVQREYPELVHLASCDVSITPSNEKISKTGYNLLSIDYVKLVPILIQSVRELTEEIERIKKHINM